jgi:hypothetical protein
MRIPLKGGMQLFARTPPNNVRECSCSPNLFAFRRMRSVTGNKRNEEMDYKKVSSIGNAEMADKIRKIADQVASGNYVIAAVVACDYQENIKNVCGIDANVCSPELIDFLVDRVRTWLFELYADDEDEREDTLPMVQWPKLLNWPPDHDR